jgi:hypothetical protein
MSELERLSPEAKAALDAARSAEPHPSAEDKARIRALLATAVAAPIALDPTPALASSSIGIKLGGALLVVGIAAAAVIATRPVPRPVPPPAPASEVTLEPLPAVAPELPPARPAPRRAVKRSPPPVISSSASRLAEEAALLREAKAALRAGDRDAALAKVNAHAKRFPDGELKEERVAVEAMATCNAELLPPKSRYRAAVEAHCRRGGSTRTRTEDLELRE